MKLKFNPEGKELYEIVIASVAIHFNLSPRTLTHGKSLKVVDVYKRHICFYLIRKYDDLLSRDFIAKEFNTCKSTVEYGENKISSTITFRRTLGDIEDIQNIISRFIAKKKEAFLIN